jgi:hypothetical protein
VTGLPIRSIGTDWSGERLVDWTTGGANQRFYGLRNTSALDMPTPFFF